MYAEDEDSDWDEVDSEEERREAEEALYHQIYHTYQGNEHSKYGLVMRENASFQNGLDISKSGQFLAKEKTVPITSLKYSKLLSNIKRCGNDEDSTHQTSKGEGKVKSAYISDSGNANSDSEDCSECDDILLVKQPIRTYGKVTIAKPTKTPSPLKVRNRDTFRELSRGCSLGNSHQGTLVADDELEGFQGSDDDDLEDSLERVESSKGGSVNIRYESSKRILGSDCQKLTEKKILTKKTPSKVFQNGENISKRYYSQSKLGDSYLKCYNCFMLGHIAKDCPEQQVVPTCPLCGVKGHTSYVCPHQLCFNCDRPGHQSKLCPFPYQSPYYQCSRCTMYGHMEQMCPDNWRQYHLTTEDGDLITAEEPSLKADKMFCYNCGLKGHLGHMCEKPRMTVKKGEMIKLPSMPLVCLYKKQKTRKRDRKMEKHIIFKDLDSKVCGNKTQKTTKPNGKMGQQFIFTADDVDTERKVCQYKKQKKRKRNGKMGKQFMFTGDVNTVRKADRRTQAQNSSFEGNSVQTNWHKSKRKKRQKLHQTEFHVTVSHPFDMTLRKRKNQNERSQIDLAGERVRDYFKPMYDRLRYQNNGKHKKMSKPDAMLAAQEEI